MEQNRCGTLTEEVLEKTFIETQQKQTQSK